MSFPFGPYSRPGIRKGRTDVGFSYLLWFHQTMGGFYEDKEFRSSMRKSFDHNFRVSCYWTANLVDSRNLKTTWFQFLVVLLCSA